MAQGPGSVGLRYEAGVGAVPDWANAASRRREPGPVSASARGLPHLLSSETTAKGTGLAELAGKEDPVELDSSPTL